MFQRKKGRGNMNLGHLTLPSPEISFDIHLITFPYCGTIRWANWPLMKYLRESCSVRWGTYFPHIPGPQSHSESVEEVIIDTRAHFWLWSHSWLFSQMKEWVPNGICRCGVCVCLFTGSGNEGFWKWPTKLGNMVRAIYHLSTPQHGFSLTACSVEELPPCQWQALFKLLPL